MGKATRVHENVHKSLVVWENMPIFASRSNISSYGSIGGKD